MQEGQIKQRSIYTFYCLSIKNSIENRQLALIAIFARNCSVVVAIIPGLGEELFFRGLLMRFAAKRTRNIYFPLVLSSLMFALLHTNVYGMLSIFLAGLILGSFYYLTGSLWSSILAHICFNGFQVLLIYFSKDGAAAQAMEHHSVPVPLVIGSTFICAGAYYLLWKNRTPLAADWHADYSREEKNDKGE